ncbi:hypothetical protein AHF37_01732 [Paragonimus kellicotti]|nr:hypothetical protein AHF37_01732 [Paragonimus kellicotti]
MSCTGDVESDPASHSPDLGISARDSVEVVNEVSSDNLNKPSRSVGTDVTATPYGPLTESEAERLQREANEDTTRSEDLRQFLKEMREKLKEEQQKQHLPTAGSVGASYGPPVSNPSASQYSLTGPQPQPNYDKEADQPRRLSAAYMVNQGPNKLTSQVHRPSLTDLTNPEAPPDGGWGWIVVLSSFCCMILVDGVSLSYGLLLSPQCGYSSLKVTAPSPGMTQSTRERPLISALTNQFDFRPVAMTGAALSTVALLLASFADNIEQLIASFGLLGGIGFALIYLPAIATVGHWFQQQRPLAVGLALCGSGVGCLLGAQAVPRLVDWFTWRGTLILMAAASFQCMSVIVLFRPLEVHMRISQVQRVKRAAREAARIAAAARRAEAERMLFEARQRKRLAAAKMAAAQQLEYQKQLQQKQQQLVRAKLSANTMMVGSIPKADLKRTEVMLQARGGALHIGPGARPRMGTVITRSGRGGRIIAMNPPGHVVVGLNSARSHATTSGGWLRNRTNSGRGSQGKPAAGRRVVVYRSQLRVNLPLVVQEYIHSQLSLSFQQHQLQPPPSYRQSISFIDPSSTVGQPRPSSLTDQVVASEQQLAVSPNLPITTSIDVTATDVPAGYSTPAKGANPPVIASFMNWASSNQLDPSTPISELPNDTADQPPAPANSVSKPLANQMM